MQKIQSCIRLCSVCGEPKQYMRVPGKAAGFIGRRCWDCALHLAKLKRQQDPTKTRAASKKQNAKRIADGRHAKYIATRLQNPLNKLAANLRSLLSTRLKTRNWNKERKPTLDLLGCTMFEFAAHLESQFLPGMSWDNYGKWHLDHIVPVASAANIDELLALQHYTNFQPLWAIDNIKKGSSQIVTVRRELLR